MAEAMPTFVDVSEKGDGSVMVVTWADVPEGMACFPARLPNHTIKTIMAFGEFGGALVEVEGSNDGVNWLSMSNPDAVISFNGESIMTLPQYTVLFKPRIIGGLGTKLNFSVLCIAPQALRN